MDFIFIEELRLETLIGVYDWERHRRQTIQLDLEIGLRDLTAAGSDDVADTVDYGKVCERLRGLAADSHFALIETLAEAVAAIVLSEFHAAWVKVRVTKLGLMRDVRRVGIVIQRGRQPG
ncbi:MAG: dihydroneopterin aldolase [Pseudomonadota bacterium]|nr:dihydroneopterin aldolase [Pseudomonadota bacterium]